jgi:hypothetical protein
MNRAPALLLALVGWLGSGAALAAGLLWGALRCDDACGGSGWRASSTAWQWSGVAALGIAAFVAGTALLLSVATRRRILGALSLVGGYAAAYGLATALSPDWRDHAGRHGTSGLLLLTAAVAAPALAVAFTPKRHAA